MEDIGVSVLKALIVLISISGFQRSLVAGERVVVDGVVHTTKDNIGNIREVNLMEDDGVIFKITLNETGKKLGKGMDGKPVEVIRDVRVTGDDAWLEVRNYQEVEGNS